jgi:hypothetical protein
MTPAATNSSNREFGSFTPDMQATALPWSVMVISYPATTNFNSLLKLFFAARTPIETEVPLTVASSNPSRSVATFMMLL